MDIALKKKVTLQMLMHLKMIESCDLPIHIFDRVAARDISTYMTCSCLNM